jgi:sugar phosphate isomerase/epimerase
MNVFGQFIPGLVSITFRPLSTADIIALVKKAGLSSIEWGADVHVKPGDLATAAEVGARTRDAGLVVSSYGSYYHAGSDQPDDFAAILESAAALGAPRIRVWSGRVDAADASEHYRARVVEDLRRICAMSAQRHIRVAMEFHGGTLSSTAVSARAILDAVPELDAYWQVRVGATPDEALADIAALSPSICHAHVFQWSSIPERLPLADGATHWPRYLQALSAQGSVVHAQIEYVKNDSPEQLLADAAILRDWLAQT